MSASGLDTIRDLPLTASSCANSSSASQQLPVSGSETNLHQGIDSFMFGVILAKTQAFEEAFLGLALGKGRQDWWHYNSVETTLVAG